MAARARCNSVDQTPRDTTQSQGHLPGQAPMNVKQFLGLTYFYHRHQALKLSLRSTESQRALAWLRRPLLMVTTVTLSSPSTVTDNKETTRAK